MHDFTIVVRLYTCCHAYGRVNRNEEESALMEDHV